MSDVEATNAAAYRAALEASRALIDRSETSGIDDALADSLRLWEQENAEQLAGACAVASALCSLLFALACRIVKLIFLLCENSILCAIGPLFCFSRRHYGSCH